MFEKEPLPSDSELWTHPGVTITPHVAGGGVGYRSNVKKVNESCVLVIVIQSASFFTSYSLSSFDHSVTLLLQA